MLEPENGKLTLEETRKVFIERISKAKPVRTIEEYQLDRKAAKDWLSALGRKNLEDRID